MKENFVSVCSNNFGCVIEDFEFGFLNQINLVEFEMNHIQIEWIWIKIQYLITLILIEWIGWCYNW